MNCKSTREMLSAYLDRELATPERDAVRCHLADCDRCRVEERDLRALKGLLLGVRAPEPAQDFEERLMRRLHEEAVSPLPHRFEWPKFRPLVWAQFGGLAAAAALGTFVFVHTPEAPAVKMEPVPQKGMVAQNELDNYAERDDAYSRSDDFTAGSSLLTTSYAP